MRTTITIDDDIIKRIASIAEHEGRTRRDVLNDVLRQGINAMHRRPTEKKPFRTASKDLGRCLIPSIDNVAEALSVAEGEGFS